LSALHVSQDIAQYNDPSNLEDAKEESGWKLVHGDVFRPPATYPMLFRCSTSWTLVSCTAQDPLIALQLLCVFVCLCNQLLTSGF
jgi:UDP-2,3-diacylglucosamine pyrophosphatase LpxH